MTTAQMRLIAGRVEADVRAAVSHDSRVEFERWLDPVIEVTEGLVLNRYTHVTYLVGPYKEMNLLLNGDVVVDEWVCVR